jgi:hypothetical protein
VLLRRPARMHRRLCRVREAPVLSLMLEDAFADVVVPPAEQPGGPGATPGVAAPWRRRTGHEYPPLPVRPTVGGGVAGSASGYVFCRPLVLDLCVPAGCRVDPGVVESSGLCCPPGPGWDPLERPLVELFWHQTNQIELHMGRIGPGQRLAAAQWRRPGMLRWLRRRPLERPVSGNTVQLR